MSDLQTVSVSVAYFWEDKNEYFVTSVDNLLEQLVAARFTVEEKKRIRRNLQVFRPITVSKAKPDSEAFFELIMGFPSPNPRSIEAPSKCSNGKSWFTP
jgi:hypothetical protein